MQRLNTVAVLVAGFALASTLHAQQPATPVEAPKAAAPALSDSEKVAIDVLALISQRDQALKDLGACTASLAPLQASQRETQLRERIAALRQSIEQAHPGYKWDIEKGTLVPAAPATAKK